MISVIIPVHNAEKFISRCVDSVLQSTYSDLQILLIENCSTDNSLEICRKYEKNYGNVKVYVADKAGVSHARNIGLDHAKGEYIAFVDADDYISPLMYELLVRGLDKNQADFVFCDFYEGKDEAAYFESKEKACVCNEVQPKEYYYNLYIKEKRSYIAPWNKLIKREVIGNLRFDETLRVAEDKSFIARCIYNCKKIYSLSEKLYFYYINSNSVCANPNKDSDIWFDMVRALIKDYDFMEIQFPENKLFKKYVSCCIVRTADFHLKWAQREKNIRRIEELNYIIKKNMLEILGARELEVQLKFRILIEHYFPHMIQRIHKLYGKV